MKPIVNLYKLGRMPYVKALNVQRILFENLKKNVVSLNAVINSNRLESDESQIKLKQKLFINNVANDTTQHHKSSSIFHSFYPFSALRNSLILVEHEPVYTVGIRSKEYNEEYVSKLKNQLAKHKLKADLIKTDRGGLITFHGPGQLVAYPIIYLGDFTKIHNKSVKAYVNLLESTIIDTLSKAGIRGAHTVHKYPGVWLGEGERKIAFIGISCRRYVTMHGISINCDCNLSWFDHIVSCGIEDKSITSIRQELLSKKHLSVRQLYNCNRIDKKNDVFTSHNQSSFPQDPKHCNRNPSVSVYHDDDDQDSNFRNYDVEHIANLFCSSFSQIFDCELRDTKFQINFETDSQQL